MRRSMPISKSTRATKTSRSDMAEVRLYDYQADAVAKMKDGCILCGGVGSGKSRTSLAYYYKEYGGKINAKRYFDMTDPPDLYIITTARKRDTLEWETELAPFLMSTDPNANHYKNKVVVDSWNNIQKYVGVKGAFFIFDEQRVVGSGVWVKLFLKIAKANRWILLSATPGDTWMDYIPVFVANGFYKNRTEFIREHVIYKSFTQFPQIDRYVCTKKLERLRNDILVGMDFERQTVSHHEVIYAEYNKTEYKDILKTRWNKEKEQPIESAGELCYLLRKTANSDPDRIEHLRRLLTEHPKAIIFYNFNYELDLLRKFAKDNDIPFSEWNGQEHQPIKTGDRWIYLVQYTAGCEGWNCITTDTVIFYSQSYSYKTMEQASGRINRLNTPYTDLYYYHLKSFAGIDIAIGRALNEKKQFNVKAFADKAR